MHKYDFILTDECNIPVWRIVQGAKHIAIFKAEDTAQVALTVASMLVMNSDKSYVDISVHNAWVSEECYKELFGEKE